MATSICPNCGGRKEYRATLCRTCWIPDSGANCPSFQHGGEGTQLYRRWGRMKARCTNPRNKDWARYGGRGIRVCDEWLNNYPAFRDWALAHGYADNLQLDRYPDNDGNYEPTNCRWTTNLENSNNKHNIRFVSAFGEKKSLTQWTRDPRCSITRAAIAYRLAAGWTPEEAICAPAREAA